MFYSILVQYFCLLHPSQTEKKILPLSPSTVRDFPLNLYKKYPRFVYTLHTNIYEQFTTILFSSTNCVPSAFVEGEKWEKRNNYKLPYELLDSLALKTSLLSFSFSFLTSTVHIPRCQFAIVLTYLRPCPSQPSSSSSPAS